MKRKRVIVVILIIVLVIGVIIGKSILNKKNAKPEVKVTAVKKGELKVSLSTTGVIKSRNIKNYFGGQFKVNKVNFKTGDEVKKGDVIATFDTNDISYSVKQSEINYRNAVLTRDEVYKQRDSMNSTIRSLDEKINSLKESKNPIDMQMYEALKSEREKIKPISEESIKKAENAVELAKLNLDSSKSKEGSSLGSIVADFDGVITALNLQEGSPPAGNLPAATIQDMNNLKVVININKYDVGKVAKGNTGEAIFNNEKVPGEITFIDPVAKESVTAQGSERSVIVEMELKEPLKGAKIDFEVDVNILLNKKDNVIKIPAEALKSDKKDSATVMVYENDKAVEKNIKIGIQSDTEVEVLEGLRENEEVILNPSSNLKTNSEVKKVN